MKYLYKLKKEQYQQGANAALSNAKDHLIISELCSEKGIIGMANSHLVIACEELCKASILKIKSLLPHIKIADLKEYFFDHKIKHKKIQVIYIAVTLLSNENFKNNKHILSTNNTWKVLLLLILILIALAFTNKSNPNAEMSFEEMRTRGFYVDLKDDKSWLIPNELFAQQDFKPLLSQVKDVFREIEDMLFDGKLTHDELEQLARQLGYLKTRFTMTT